MLEQKIIKRIEEELRLQDDIIQEPGRQNLDKKWDSLVSTEPKRFINEDLTLNVDALRNFRKSAIFIPDDPTYNPSFFNLKNLLSGRRRGMRKLMRECYDVLKENGYEYLLKKYPANPVGNPYCFTYKGVPFTARWFKHMSYLGLLKKYRLEKLTDDFTALDIGSSYGIFSYLLKKEFPNSRCLLLDFPQQLVLAHYFLGMNFPNAKIASFKELSAVDKIDRDFVKRYDFLLIPVLLYKKLAPKSVDLVTNFASLGEMSRVWFDYYLKNEPFLSAKYFFTVNRVQSYPTYDTDLTLLDYPLGDFKRIHFGVWPIFHYEYKGILLFFSEKSLFSSQYFEFIGEREYEKE